MSVAENNDSPFDDRRIPIARFLCNAASMVERSDAVVAKAKELGRLGLKPKDALHVACAIKAGCDFFLTTDDQLARRRVDGIEIINPIDFIRVREAELK